MIPKSSSFGSRWKLKYYYYDLYMMLLSISCINFNYLNQTIVEACNIILNGSMYTNYMIHVKCVTSNFNFIQFQKGDDESQLHMLQCTHLIVLMHLIRTNIAT